MTDRQIVGGRPQPANRHALAALALTIALELATIYVRPLADVLGTVPLGTWDLAVVAGLALVPVVV